MNFRIIFSVVIILLPLSGAEIRFPLGFLDAFIKPEELTSERFQVNIGLAYPVPVLPLSLNLGLVDFNLVDRAFGPFQLRVDFPRLSIMDREIRVYFPVTIRLQRD